MYEEEGFHHRPFCSTFRSNMTYNKDSYLPYLCQWQVKYLPKLFAKNPLLAFLPLSSILKNSQEGSFVRSALLKWGD